MITIKIEKDTPEEVMDATALFINDLKNIIHAKATESVQVETGEISETMIRKDPTPAKIIPVAPKAHVFIPPAPVVPEVSTVTVDSDVPTPTNIAPIVPAVPEVATTSGAEVDVAGMAWDTRIHSRGKSKNVDGTWRRKRGISEELIKQVEAEIKNSDLSTDTLVPAIPAPIPAPVAIGGATANPFANTQGAGNTNNGTVAPAVPPVPQAAPVGAAVRSYSDLETLISQLILSNQTDGAKVMAVCAANSLAAVTLLKDADPSLIAKVYAEIEASAA